MSAPRSAACHKDKVLAMDAEKRAVLAAGGEALLQKREASRPGPAEESALCSPGRRYAGCPGKELASSQAKKRGAAGSLFRLVEREEVTYALTPAGATDAALH